MSSNNVESLHKIITIDLDAHVSKFYRKKNNRGMKAFAEKHGKKHDFKVTSIYKARDLECTKQYRKLIGRVAEAMSKDREESKVQN